MTEDSKAVAQRLFKDVWVNHELDAVDRYYAENFVDHNHVAGMPSGREGVKALARLYTSAFPDLKVQDDLWVAEGDTVVEHWTAKGTHRGELLGIKPTGKPVEFSGVTIGRFRDGKIVELWTETDQLTLMRQLGKYTS
jgi:steroid delta-isomerase-like uncharacterized protein